MVNNENKTPVKGSKSKNPLRQAVLAEMDRRITLTRSSIVGALLSGDNPQKVSFRHVLNRIMVLIQVSMTFVIFKRETHQFRLVARFNKHHRDQDAINDCINGIVDEKIAADNKQNQRSNELFKIIGTDYYLLAIRIDKRNGVYKFYQLRKVLGDPKGRTDYLAYMIEKCLETEPYRQYGLNFIEHIRHSVESMSDGTDKKSIFFGEKNDFSPMPIQKSTPEPKAPFKFDQTLADDVQRRMDLFLYKNKDHELSQDLVENGYLDRLYRKVKRNLSTINRFTHSSKGKEKKPEDDEAKPIANYVLFIRDYAVPDDYVRHSGYQGSQGGDGFNYRVRIALCSQQADDAKAYFKRLHKSHESGSGVLGYQKSIEGKGKLSEGYRKLAGDLDQAFWQMLKNDINNEKATTEWNLINILQKPFAEWNLIEILKRPFGIRARSASDLVLEGGVVHFRRPFADGGIARCFPKGDNIPESLEIVRNNSEKFGDITDDLMRLVISYYWYQGMATDTHDPRTELGIMLVPIEVGNRIWSVVGYFTTLFKEDAKIEAVAELEANSEAWNINYHIFHDVNDRLKKELRRSVSNCHKDLLSEYYADLMVPDNWRKWFSNRFSVKGRNAVIEQWINSRFCTISRFFSYERIEISIKEGPGGPSLRAQQNSHGANIVVFPDGEKPEEQSAEPATPSPQASAGAYLTENAHSATFRHSNSFFPAPLGSANEFESSGATVPVEDSRINYLDLRDVQVRLTSAYVRSAWREVLAQSRKTKMAGKSDGN